MSTSTLTPAHLTPDDDPARQTMPLGQSGTYPTMGDSVDDADPYCF
jgi:hypothetical protein